MPETCTTNFHKEHRQRVKQRFLADGLTNFAPHEALELLLFYAVPQKDTNVLAHRLLDRFGSLAGVMDATQEELCAVEGVGEHVAVLLRLLMPLATRVMTERETGGGGFDTVEEVGDYFVRRFAGENSETVQLLLLDNARNPIDCVRVYEGSVNAVAITPRMLIEIALAHRASFAVLAHNHPGGMPIPSGDDLTTTRNMRDAFSAVGIPLLEHILVAGGVYTPILHHMQNTLSADTRPLYFAAEHTLRSEKT